jgi:hypothetical protein
VIRRRTRAARNDGTDPTTTMATSASDPTNHPGMRSNQVMSPAG